MVQLEREFGLVGETMDKRMTQQLVSTARQMTVRYRHPLDPLIHHCDRGSQYTSQAFQELLLTDNNIARSMSGCGNCYDNTQVESFFDMLKAELVHHADYQTRQEAMTDIFFYNNGFYNPTRRHSTLGYVSPAGFEAAYAQQLVFESCNFVSINLAEIPMQSV